MNFADRYIGLPYAERGRGPDAYDCLGLVQRIFRDELGVDLPEHLGCYPAAQARAADLSLRDDDGATWQHVAMGEERFFDVVLIRERPWHVGLVVRRGDMLHMPLERDSVIESYIGRLYSSRVEGIYRHPRLFL